ncbi:MAG: TetR family transcriptional regulator [Actinophytocola sp.]|uniref:TetR/AcrR family transcriptional regulator n=1 Tax=Actinophytocola sp. TaxID=1872138 RepID=UPI001328ACA5|nr:TetR/AcrR family transcriptional regulator [Actinophytocola sp.]MPZ81126.1 TetR family transcriptional regulator [Actinophytocola sp.]
MPKRVDHDERRRELAAALVRCAGVHGLHATGFREVAREAGVSVNLVQYYFPTKAELLRGGLLHLRATIATRLPAPGEGPPAAQVRAIMHELLPTDEVSADLYRLHAAYAALAFTDPRLADQPHTAGPDQIQPTLAALLKEANPDADPALAATSLLALGTGLSAYLAAGHLTMDAATRVLDDQLDRVLEAG